MPQGDQRRRLPADHHTMRGRSSGSLLAVTDVSIDPPTYQPTSGQVWQVGWHRLIVTDVFSGWPLWAPHLASPQVLFVPYPGPYVLLSNRALASPLVLVQPDPYLAGHLLDKYAAVHGDLVIGLLEAAVVTGPTVVQPAARTPAQDVAALADRLAA